MRQLHKIIWYKVLNKIISKNKIYFSLHFKALYSKYIYQAATGKYLNLHNPKNINEKIMWLKLYYSDPLIIKCSDKYKVREYVEDMGCASILNQLIGVYDSSEEIDFKTLPNKFALKANHGCGYNIICDDKNKLDIGETKRKLTKWLSSVYGVENGEWHYSRIRPRIICEKYLEHSVNQTSVSDYKIHCLNGEPHCILVYYNRTEVSKVRTSYNLQWERIYILKKEGNDCERPVNLDQMIQTAKALANPFPYVRVDLYEIEGILFFGELTFTPHGGFQTNFKDEVLLEMGQLLKLPLARNAKR